MRKIAKYLKPFGLALLAVVGLLFLQAYTDLNLPNYMSDIVNVGIQQGGVQNAAPTAISADGMTLMTTFMDDGEKQLVEASYTKIPRGDAAYEAEYPEAANTDIYVENDVDADTEARLNDAFGLSAWTMIELMQNMENSPEAAVAQSGGQMTQEQAAALARGGMTEEQQAATTTADAAAADTADAQTTAAAGAAGGSADMTSELENLDFSEVYQMLPMIGQLPPQAISEARAQAQEIPESMRTQTGAAFAKAFYNELGMDVAKIQSGYIATTGLWMLLIAVIGAAASIVVGLLGSRVAAGMARNLRRDVFRKVESFSLVEYNKFSTASLITRTTNDITQVQQFVVMGVRMLLYAPIMGAGGIIMALSKSASMAWIIALAVIILTVMIVAVFLIAMPKFKIMQKLIDRLNLVARENLSGMLVIRAFGTQKHEEERFDTANQNLTRTNLFVNRVMVLMMPIMMFVMNGISLLIVWVGAHQIEASALQVGDMMAYIQYVMMIIMAFLMIAMIFIMVPRASVSAGRIAEVLDTPLSITDPKQPKPFDPAKKGVVEFKNVSFKYGGAEDDVLEGLNFTALPGQTTAFIGSTGAGKSTLVNLIPRFYDVTGGSILVSGADVRDVDQHDLRQQIGYVPQKGMLFSGTVASNLRYGAQDASDEEIEQAAKIAQAWDFISEKEDGLESHVSEGGANVSGGQKQRLSIARALAKKAPVYIFDDSFSALDFKTDAALRRALKPYTKESTVLIVAQRVSTILHADQIIVLDDGKIVGKGTHEELMKDCPTYREIAESQIGGEA